MKTIKELEDNLTQEENIFFMRLKEHFKQEDFLNNKPEFYYLILENKKIFNDIYQHLKNYFDSDIDFYFEKNEDRENYYKLGDLAIYIENYDYTYFLEFRENDDSRGYCECQPEQKGYDERYKCCGIYCDRFVPSFSFYKKRNDDNRNWKHMERDLWNIQDEWNEVSKDELEEIQKQEKKKRQIEEYNREIKRLERMKNELLNN